MFTGIIDHYGYIKKIEKIPSGIRLTIGSTFNEIIIGESIAVDGVCLTVTEYKANEFAVDISPETLQLSLIRHYCVNDKVNLERSLRLSDRLSGHFVTGHTDGLAVLQEIIAKDEFKEYIFKPTNTDFVSFLTKKGSVALNGVSLTLNEVNMDYFSVMLIPHTLTITNLSSLEVGDVVNIEYDYLAKILYNQLTVMKHEKF